MKTITSNPPIAKAPTWSAVGSMTLCVAMLIASEFMPVSLLTPIAAELHATEGMAGQAISVSGLFAVAGFARRYGYGLVVARITLIWG